MKTGMNSLEPSQTQELHAMALTHIDTLQLQPPRGAYTPTNDNSKLQFTSIYFH